MAAMRLQGPTRSAKEAGVGRIFRETSPYTLFSVDHFFAPPGLSSKIPDQWFSAVGLMYDQFSNSDPPPGPCSAQHSALQTAGEIDAPVPVLSTQGHLREATWNSISQKISGQGREVLSHMSGRPQIHMRCLDGQDAGLNMLSVHRKDCEPRLVIGPPPLLRTPFTFHGALPPPTSVINIAVGDGAHQEPQVASRYLYDSFPLRQPDKDAKSCDIYGRGSIHATAAGRVANNDTSGLFPNNETSTSTALHRSAQAPPSNIVPTAQGKPEMLSPVPSSQSEENTHLGIAYLRTSILPQRKYIRVPTTSLPPSTNQEQHDLDAAYMRKAFCLPEDAGLTLADLPDGPPGVRPQYSTTLLTALAIRSSPKKRLTLQGIFSALQNRFEWFASHNGSKSWKNSIRHNLSLALIFKQVPRHPYEPGKGDNWVLDFSRGVGTKRPRKRRNKKSTVNRVDTPSEGLPALEQSPTPPSSSGVSNVNSGFAGIYQDQEVTIPVDEGYIIEIYSAKTREIIHRLGTSMKPSVKRTRTSIIVRNCGKMQSYVDYDVESKMEDLPDDDFLGYPTESEYDEIESEYE